MKDAELFKILNSQGESSNFSIGLYENATDKENTRLAKKIAKEFISFGKFCEDNELEMTSGIREFPSVGMGTYLAISKKESSITHMVLIVPHDIIEIRGEDSE